jgi:hypothetical protein
MMRFDKSVADEVRGLGMTEVKGVANVWEGTPDWPSFRALMDKGPEMTRTGPGAVQYDSYIAFFYANRCAGAYSYVTETTLYNEGNFLVQDKPLQEVGQGTMVKYCHAADTGIVESVDNPGPSQSTTNRVIVTDAYVVGAPMCSRNTKIAVNIWGSLASKKGHGLFFTYFPGLMEADSGFGPSVIQRLMFRLLAKDAKDASAVMVDIRNGFRSLVHHRGGEQLTHALLGCHLAEQSQTMLQFVEVKGVYRGFVLRGDFDLLIRGKIVALQEWSDLKDTLALLSKHDSSLKKIVALIHGKTLDDGSQKYNVKIDAIRTSWNFRDIFLSLDFNDFIADDKKAIIKLVDDLDFGSATYASSKFSNIKLFLDYVRTGDITPLKSYDTFFGDGQIWRAGRVAVGLSIFGSLPPSVSIGRGPGCQKFQIPYKDEALDANLAVTDGKRRIPFLPYKRKIISEASQEWNKLLSTGLLVLPPGNEKKKEFVQASYKDGAFGGGEFLVAYNAIRNVYKAIGSERTEGGKRKEADDVDEGTAAKRGKKSQADAKGKGKLLME